LEALRVSEEDEVELGGNLPSLDRSLRAEIYLGLAKIKPLIKSDYFLMPKQLLHPKIPTPLIRFNRLGIFNSFTMIIRS
jgi:hypothetical protein